MNVSLKFLKLQLQHTTQHTKEKLHVTQSIAFIKYSMWTAEKKWWEKHFLNILYFIFMDGESHWKKRM